MLKLSRLNFLRTPHILFMVFVLVTLTSCYNDNEEDIYINFDNGIACDTVNVSYSEGISSLLNSRCVTCHDASHSSCVLDTYAAASLYALRPNSNLYTKVADNTHENIVLSPCDLKQLKIWIENGALEN